MKEDIINFLSSRKIFGPILIIFLAIISYKIIEYLIDKTTIKGKSQIDKKRRQTIIILFSNVIKYFIAAISSIIILNIYGVDTTSIIAGLGIAGVVIGLAFQDALKDIISGINIIMDNYYVVGDNVKYNNFEGTIISFGLKTTKIKSENGEVLTVANRNISSIINLSQKSTVMFFEITVGNDVEDIEQVIKEILYEIKKIRNVYSKESIYLGIERLKSTSLTHLFQVKCLQEKEKEIKRKINRIIIEKTKEKNIEIKD